MRVRVANGLTPPPGLQEPHALAGFQVALCADGISLGAPARLCFALAVRDVRSYDSLSLEYRVRAAVPAWVAPWVYDLKLRFPGGEAELPGSVIVGEPPCDPQAPLACMRVHLGPRGLRSTGAAHPRYYPLPTRDGHFARGSVALLPHPLSALPTLRSGAEFDTKQIRFAPVGAVAGRPAAVALTGVPRDFAAFLRIDGLRSAVGTHARVQLLPGGAEPIEGVVIAKNGSALVLRQQVTVAPQVEAGCALSARRAAAPRLGALVLASLGLLFFALLRRLRGRCELK